MNQTLEDWIEEQKKSNPFRDNHIFSKEDSKRGIFNKWDYPILFFLPMYVQITDEGVAKFKIWRGQYFFYGFEPLEITHAK